MARQPPLPRSRERVCLRAPTRGSSRKARRVRPLPGSLREPTYPEERERWTCAPPGLRWSGQSRPSRLQAAATMVHFASARAAADAVDTRKWLLSKMLPKIFGDRTAAEHSGDVTLEQLVMAALAPRERRHADGILHPAVFARIGR